MTRCITKGSLLQCRLGHNIVRRRLYHDFLPKLRPVAIQGNCSYSIFAGQNLEYVFQFRLSTLPLSISTLHQARKVHGSLVPEVWTYGQLEDLHVYAMPRIQGVSYLDFVLADKYPRTSHQSISFRSQLMADIGR